MESWAVVAASASAPTHEAKVPVAHAVQGSRGKRRRGQEDAEIGLRALCVQTARLALNVDREIRQLKGMVLTTALVPEFEGARQAAEESGRRTEDAAARAWARLLLDLSQNPVVTAEVRARLAVYCQAMGTPEAVLGNLKHFYAAATHDNPKVYRIQYMLSGMQEYPTIATDVTVALVGLGATIKHGAPPRSGAARAVQKALASM